MYEDSKYEYVTVDTEILIGSTRSYSQSGKVYIPNGKVVAIGTIVAGNINNAILNFALLDNSTEILRPSDVRFSEKTLGGSFLESLRPVDFEGGRSYDVQLTSPLPITSSVIVQTLFMIQKPS